MVAGCTREVNKVDDELCLLGTALRPPATRLAEFLLLAEHGPGCVVPSDAAGDSVLRCRSMELCPLPNRSRAFLLDSGRSRVGYKPARPRLAVRLEHVVADSMKLKINLSLKSKHVGATRGVLPVARTKESIAQATEIAAPW